MLVRTSHCDSKIPLPWMSGGDLKSPGRPARILVIDDCSGGREMISGILGCIGLDVETACDGREGVEQAIDAQRRGQPFAMVLMDMEMPRTDGYRATRRLRSLGYDRLVIALTSFTLDSTRAKCLKAGCDDHAAKPISFELLGGIVRRHLRHVGIDPKLLQ